MKNKIELRVGKRYLFKEVIWPFVSYYYDATVVDFAQDKGWDKKDKRIWKLVKLKESDGSIRWEEVSKLQIIEDFDKEIE